MKEILTALRALVVLTIVTGILYPLAVTGIAQALFPEQARGSLVKRGDSLVGSSLLAQKFVGVAYFHPRPSAVDFSTVASGASNQGFTSKKLLDAVNERRNAMGTGAPPDLLYTSGSGLDPHISPEAAAFQTARVAAARGWSTERIDTLIAKNTEEPQYGILGQARINVLKLNIALDRQ